MSAILRSVCPGHPKVKGGEDTLRTCCMVMRGHDLSLSLVIECIFFYKMLDALFLKHHQLLSAP